ncbi:hypothetical protein PVAP13_2NG231303 [Panicum virgatum]|uniref:ELM2 domain-containing protein n=1 Tax=Panicum virgatum TaxID=38727 RepID=A0A8T0VBD4_PANVG|nr:hypothetical protein PVAP13_2NG231303 [Panicum virgatum]
MQAMHAELNALRQAPELGAAAYGFVPVAPSGVATGGGEPVVAPQRPLELRDWCGMSLEKFAGTGAPIEAADWLSAVIDKLESFHVHASDWVPYAHQLLKGEALVWWRNVQLSRPAARGPITWIEFVIQFERRFYPVSFVDKMKTQLERCHQGKRTVTEYEMDFNHIVRFVPHVDFRSTVERALGVEKDLKGHFGGPIQKKDKHHHHQPYSGTSSQSRASGGGSRDGSTQYRAIVKPGLGLCSRCGKDHKEVVCRKNLNSKVVWEPVSSSLFGQRGSPHMMTGVSFGQQHSTPTQEFLPISFVPQYLPASSS